MIETMIEYHGVGLAAPQVHESVRLFVATIDPADDEPGDPAPVVIINPEITPVGSEVVEDWEGAWRRKGTFVNTGWIERVLWLSPDRLLISGFSNPRDGGMVAILDANALDGQSPPSDDETFRCTSCGSAVPVRYVVFPRSELNRVTASPFNRAIVELNADRIIVHTIEMPSTGAQATDAVYDFSRSLEPLRASFSDHYWEMHRALEAAGKIHHTREHCPERDGPGKIAVWDPATGWVPRSVPH